MQCGVLGLLSLECERTVQCLVAARHTGDKFACSVWLNGHERAHRDLPRVSTLEYSGAPVGTSVYWKTQTDRV